MVAASTVPMGMMIITFNKIYTNVTPLCDYALKLVPGVVGEGGFQKPRSRRRGRVAIKYSESVCDKWGTGRGGPSCAW